METSIFPIAYSTETTSAVPAQEVSQPDGDFAKALADHFQKGGKEKTDPSERQAENPASSMIGYLLSALMSPNLPAVPDGNDLSSSNSGEATNKAASSPGPSGSEPLPQLPSTLPLPDVLDGEQIQSINFDGRYPVPQLLNPQGSWVIPAGSAPSGFGQQGTWAASPGGKESWVSPQSPNSPGEKVGPLIQEQVTASKINERGPLSEETIPGKGFPSNLAAKSGKSVILPMVGEGINKENKEKLPLQKEPSPATATWSSRALDQRSPTLDGAMPEKTEKTSLPQREFRPPATSANPTPLEGATLPDRETRILTSFPNSNLGDFMEGGEKGQEKILLMGNESAQFSKKAGQNDVDVYETSPVLKEGLTQMLEKPGGVKENYSPAPPKSEPQTVSQQVSQRAIWLIRNNEESVRITLDPPQLGHIYMVIDRSKEDIRATLWTDNPATKATLETSQPQIQRIIESEGFKLEKFDVFVQQETGWFHRGKDAPPNPDPRSPSSPSGIQAPLSASPDPLPAVTRTVHPASRYLDLFV